MKTVTVGPLMITLAVVSVACRGQEMPEPPKPQEEHQWLEQLVGEWDSEIEATMGPGQPAMKAKGTQSARMLGGRWLIGEGSGEMMEMKVDSVLTIGFDPAKKMYVGTWIDSCNNHLWLYEGAVDESGRSLILETEGPNPALEGKMAKFREVIELQNEDHYTFTSAMQGDDGEWVTFMTANFHRKK